MEEEAAVSAMCRENWPVWEAEEGGGGAQTFSFPGLGLCLHLGFLAHPVGLSLEPVSESS